MTSAATSGSLIDRAARAGMFRDRVYGRGLFATAVIRVVTGLLFLAAAIPKITAHQAEIDMFGQFGLPRSSALVYLVATLEITGALLLMLGLATRPAAVTLAANMTGWRTSPSGPERP